MRSEIVMPQMGESVTEGTVTKWLKEPGDYVERDEPIFEITTDKVDAEVPSPEEGVLVEKLVEVGETAAVNSVVAVLDKEAEEGEVPEADDAASADDDAGSSSDKVTNGERGPAQPAASTGGSGTSAGGAAAATATTSTDGDFPSRAELRRTRSTPLVRRIADEHGIDDLSAISGSGLSGRVTKEDILGYIEAGKHETAQPVNGRDSRPQQPATRAPQRDYDEPDIDVGDRDRVEPMGEHRRRIAEHMTRSRATSAHAHTVHEIDFQNVVDARDANKADFADRGVKLTYTPFMVKAIADALQAYPIVNASIDGDDLVYRGNINIGIAVALDGSLIVPVIENADELNLLGLARRIGDLAERARNKRLSPDEVKGGTFTLSNHGIFGPEFGVPIINQPQTAIVSAGAIKKRVVVDQKTDAMMVRPTATFCLSFDHRSIDGATADKFLAHIRETIENWG